MIILLIAGFSVKAQDGEKLFKANCASCHKIDKKLIGPALQGIRDRWESEENLYAWIKNSPKYLEEMNDPYATALFEEYNKTPMTAFPQLGDADIAAVLEYVDNYQPPTASAGGEGETGGAAQGGGVDPLWFLLPALLVLIVLAVAFSKAIGALINSAKEKDPDSEKVLPKVISLKERFGIFLKHRFTILAIVIFVLCWVFGSLWDGATSLGRQEGYQPAQPIKFSHKLHAGINKIDCKYCHVGAEKGKASVIPSLNICMNCHMAVSEGPEYGTTEIAKIYDAVGWDAEKGKYIEDYEQKPIEWIKIHNLPDHVYFNHSQHVKVGGIECQKCHGSIEEMDEVYQHAPLSMGWCIDCHRETKVNFDNKYYSDYEALHEKLKNGEIENVTVEGIGGTECQKCHY